MSQPEAHYKLRCEAEGFYHLGDYTEWLEERVLEARALARTCYDHSVLAADSSEAALDAQAKFEKWDWCGRWEAKP